VRGDRLLHPAPAAALALLLANDLVLKASFPGPVTGKLSDLAGLYLFSVFCLALDSRRPRVQLAAIAVAWVVWKSPLADPLIAGFNALAPVTLARVADPTDLIALLVIPLALIEPRPVPVRRWAGPAMAGLSMFAFAATSTYRLPTPLPGEYTLPIPRDEVLRRIYALRLDYADDGVPPRWPDRVRLRIPPADSAEAARRPWDLPSVEFSVFDAPGGSEVRLRSVSMHRTVPDDTLRAWFDRRVLERIRRNQPNPFPRAPVVSGADARFRPRLVAPLSLTEARGRVTVRLARTAAVALIEITPQNEWRMIYPVAVADERLLPAGETTLTTLCSTTKVRGDYGPRDTVPACGVTMPLTPALAVELPVASDGTGHPTGGAGRMIVLAADAPIRRAALERALADLAFPRKELYWPEVQSALGRVVRQEGGRRAAASETVLRR
jgi:hypothetical protein